MKKIGLMVAMNKELEIFTDFINFNTTKSLHKFDFHIGHHGENEVIAVVSGIGKVNAALSAADLINTFGADMIINVGISGGLSSALEIGDLIIGKDIVYHDVWCGTPNKMGQVQGLPSVFHSNADLSKLLPDLKCGLICCGDVFVDNQADFDIIKAKFPDVLAVDMESAAIAQTCYLYNKPMISIRQISDTPGVEHHAEQYETFWKNAPKNSAEIIKQLLEKI